MIEKANVSYTEYYNRAIKHLRNIEQLLEEHEKKTVPQGGATWAQVGDLTNIIAGLSEIEKFLRGQ
jgi:hypothetical protein